MTRSIADKALTIDESATPLDQFHDAVRLSKIKRLPAMLKDLPSINARAGLLAPMPLHTAARHLSLASAEWLLARGANVNARHLGRVGATALHFCLIALGDQDVTRDRIQTCVSFVDLLVKHGADPLLQTHNGLRPIDVIDDPDAGENEWQEMKDLRSLLRKITTRAEKKQILPDIDTFVCMIKPPVWTVDAILEPEPEVEPENDDGKENDVKADDECVVCLDAKKVMAGVDCGHVTMCQACATDKAVTECPVCRTSTTFIKLYL